MKYWFCWVCEKCKFLNGFRDFHCGKCKEPRVVYKKKLLMKWRTIYNRDEHYKINEQGTVGASASAEVEQ